MDIINLDKYELERYFAEHNLEDAAVGDGASLGKALEKFEAAFNLDTSLPDVKKLEDRLQGSVPPASRENFYLKLLSYVIDITNRNLPVDAAESQALLESLHNFEDNAWAEAAVNDLRTAFYFLDRWHPEPAPGPLFQQLCDRYKQTFREMCEAAGKLIITDAELEEMAKRSEERKKEQKKKWIIASILFVIGFHLVKYLLGLFGIG